MVSKSPLAKAAYEGELEEVLRCIAAGDPVDGSACGKYDDGRPYYTPLGEACRNDLADPTHQWKIVDALLEAGADVNELNYRDERALDFAAQNGRVTLVERLIQAGSELGNPINDCLTSSPSGPHGDLRETVKVLLAAGVDPRSAEVAVPTLLTKHFDLAKKLNDKDKQWREYGLSKLQLLEIIAEHPRQADWTELQKFVESMRKAAGKSAAHQRKAKDALQSLVAKHGQSDFAELVGGVIGTDPTGRGEELETFAKRVLSTPEVVEHASWGQLVRKLLALTPLWSEYAEDVYGEPVSVSEIHDDEGGALDAYSDEEQSTIEPCLLACAAAGASDRKDFAAVVKAIATHKHRAVGAMSFGDEEALALAQVLVERGQHPDLVGVLRKAWPFTDWKQLPVSRKGARQAKPSKGTAARKSQAKGR